MSGRLASFKTASSPSSSPVRPPQQVKSSKNTRTTARNKINKEEELDLGPVESPFHRKLRSVLLDIRTCANTWDDVVNHTGLRAVRLLVDSRTELANDLSLYPPQELPNARIVGPRMVVIEKSLSDLDGVIIKLKKQFGRMNQLVEGTEALLYEAVKTKGLAFVHEPLWTTWSLDLFVTRLPALLRTYNRALSDCEHMISVLRSHNMLFDQARAVVARWQAQEALAEGGWQSSWEDLCEVEVDRWD